MNANGYRIGAVAAAVGLLLASAAGADRVRDLGDGRSIMELSGRRGEEIHLRVHVAPGTDRLVITTAGGYGDCDLYLAFDRRPTPKDYLQRSAGKSTDEQIVANWPRAGTWQLLVHACDRFDGVALQVLAERRAWLEITSPIAGDVWRTGGEYAVTWQADPRVEAVRVEFSFDDGRTWASRGLSATVPADRGRLRVRLPYTLPIATHEARVRILDADRQVVLDTSDRFHIVARPILLPRRPVVIVLPRVRRPIRRLPDIRIPRGRDRRHDREVRPRAASRPPAKPAPRRQPAPPPARRPAASPRTGRVRTQRPTASPRTGRVGTQRPAATPAPRAKSGSRRRPAEKAGKGPSGRRRAESAEKARPSRRGRTDRKRRR